MNLKRCNNGHFYDGEKNNTCPYCNQTVSAAQTTVAVDTLDLAEDLPSLNVEDLDAATLSLQDAVAAATSAPVSNQDVDTNKTIGYFSKAIGTDPVVGWLVCIEGEYFGESFKLKSGRNFIGRSSSMDIVLGGDTTVSRDRHAIVVYEPKGRIFFAQPGDSKELFYLNEEVVLNNVVLKANDIISVGNTKLMLIPCCGPNFSWDELKKQQDAAK